MKHARGSAHCGIVVILKRVLGCCALVTTIGCSLEVPYNQDQPSLLRIVNAAPGVSSVAAYLNASADPLVSSLGYTEQTEGCFAIFPTTQDLNFVQGTTLIARATTSYQGGSEYTAIVANVGSTYRAIGLPDAVDVSAGNNALRFINATPTSGDVYVTPENAAPAPSYKVVASLAPLASSSDVPAYYQRPQTDVRVRFYDVGTTTTPRADFTITAIQPSRRATIVFTTPTGTSGPNAFQVHPCS